MPDHSHEVQNENVTISLLPCQWEHQAQTNIQGFFSTWLKQESSKKEDISKHR